MQNSIVTLSLEQLESMKTNGYIVLPRLFTVEEIQEIDGHLGTFHIRHEAKLKEEGGQSGISRAGEVLFSTHIAEEDEKVRDFTRCPKMVSLATQLLGGDVDLYWNQTVYKNPESNKEFPWHQDDAYTPVDPSPYLTCWLAISDATTDNGCISVLPGSHLEGLRPHQSSPIGLVGYPSDHPDQGVQVPIPSGSLILFWSTVLHKSGPNLSDGMRKAYIMQYSSTGLRKIGDRDPIPNLIPVARGGVVAK